MQSRVLVPSGGIPDSLWKITRAAGKSVTQQLVDLFTPPPRARSAKRAFFLPFYYWSSDIPLGNLTPIVNFLSPRIRNLLIVD